MNQFSNIMLLFVKMCKNRSLKFINLKIVKMYIFLHTVNVYIISVLTMCRLIS